MSHPQPHPFLSGQVPQRKRRVWPWVLGAVVLVGLIVLCAGIVSGTQEGIESRSRTVAPAGAATVAAAPATAATTAAAVPQLRAADLSLAVKLTSKECFGSAGCLVQWTIKLTKKGSATLPEQCEITYNVTGLKDGAQIGTLVLTSDGQYTQDEYASGQTARSSSKLAAKVTDVECY